MTLKLKQTADSLVFAESGENLSLLLIKRKYDPFRGSYAFPGGFLEKDEDPLISAKRELIEETSLDLKNVQCLPLSIRKKVGRDPRGPVLTYPFMFWIPEMVEVKGLDDAISAEWIKIAEIKNLAFDHGAILCEAISKFWQFFETSNIFSNVILPDFLLTPTKNKIDIEKEIVFFGGSFNPWHEGHSACITLCPSKNIIVIPDYNPWKNLNKDKDYWKSFLDILSVVRNDDVFVFPGFWGAEGPNPTNSWLGNTIFNTKSLLIGDDNFMSLLKWNNYEKVLNMLHYLYVVPRREDKETLLNKKADLLKIVPKLKINVLADHNHKNLSSTDLRN